MALLKPPGDVISLDTLPTLSHPHEVREQNPPLYVPAGAPITIISEENLPQVSDQDHEI